MTNDFSLAKILLMQNYGWINLISIYTAYTYTYLIQRIFKVTIPRGPRQKLHKQGWRQIVLQPPACCTKPLKDRGAPLGRPWKYLKYKSILESLVMQFFLTLEVSLSSSPMTSRWRTLVNFTSEM